MRHLRIVGDGHRDVAAVPQLVRAVLGSGFQHSARTWQFYVRLHRREKKVPGYVLRGYGVKLLYVLQAARAAGDDGVVATVDADKDRRHERLEQLKTAREADRARHTPLPAALGEARPHSEAWLLDDPVAVREGLGLARNADVPDVLNCDYPKDSLEDLHKHSPRNSEPPLKVWPDIAARVDVSRCNHQKETGFEAFREEVRRELGPLFANAG